jgi:hypothetical protein
MFAILIYTGISWDENLALRVVEKIGLGIAVFVPMAFASWALMGRPEGVESMVIRVLTTHPKALALWARIRGN